MQNTVIIGDFDGEPIHRIVDISWVAQVDRNCEYTPRNEAVGHNTGRVDIHVDWALTRRIVGRRRLRRVALLGSGVD